MPRRTLPTLVARLVLLVGLLGGVAAGMLVVPPAALADDPTSSGAPATQDDTTTFDAGDVKIVDVLANDTDSADDPDGTNLQVCRVSLPDKSPLSVEIRDNKLAISSPITTSGTFGVVYYACNYNYLTRAVVTVNVTKVPAVTARKTPGRAAHLTFANPGDQAVQVMYTVPSGEGPEGRVSVPAHASRTVTVTKRTVIYVAVRRSGAIVGYGTIRGIKIPKQHKRQVTHHR